MMHQCLIVSDLDSNGLRKRVKAGQTGLESPSGAPGEIPVTWQAERPGVSG